MLPEQAHGWYSGWSSSLGPRQIRHTSSSHASEGPTPSLIADICACPDRFRLFLFLPAPPAPLLSLSNHAARAARRAPKQRPTRSGLCSHHPSPGKRDPQPTFPRQMERVWKEGARKGVSFPGPGRDRSVSGLGEGIFFGEERQRGPW